MNSNDQPRADDASRCEAPRAVGQLAVLLPGRAVFAELLALALRAAGAQMRPERDGELLAVDVGVDVGEVADALHLRLECVYGHPDRRSVVPMPPLGELMRMLTETVDASSVTPAPSPSSWASSWASLWMECVDLAGLYLYLFLAPPRTEQAGSSGREAVGLRALAAFAAGDLDTDDAFEVSQALMLDSRTRSRLRDLLDIASSLPPAFPGATGIDPHERMPEDVWQRSLRTIAALQHEREHTDTDTDTDPVADPGAGSGSAS